MIDNSQLKVIKSRSVRKVTNSLIKTAWKWQLCLIMQGCCRNAYLLTKNSMAWLCNGAALLLYWTGILSNINVKNVQIIITHNCKRTKVLSDNKVWHNDNKDRHFHKKEWQHQFSLIANKKVWQPQWENHNIVWQNQCRYRRRQCHNLKNETVVLISLECRAFQAFLLSNYFITKALVIVKVFCERTIKI